MPLILALPCAGALLIAIDVADPTILGLIELVLLFCATLVLIVLATGGMAVTTIETFADPETPALFDALYVKLSLPI